MFKIIEENALRVTPEAIVAFEELIIVYKKIDIKDVEVIINLHKGDKIDIFSLLFHSIENCPLCVASTCKECVYTSINIVVLRTFVLSAHCNKGFFGVVLKTLKTTQDPELFIKTLKKKITQMELLIKEIKELK